MSSARSRLLSYLNPQQIVLATSLGVVLAFHNKAETRLHFIMSDGTMEVDLGSSPDKALEFARVLSGSILHLKGDRPWDLTKAQARKIEDLKSEGWRLMR